LPLPDRWIVSARAEPILLMPVQVVRVGPERLFGRADQRAARHRRQMAGDIIKGGQLRGKTNVIASRDGGETLVKGPVAQATERHSVANPVIAAFAPGDDVCGFNRAVSIGRNNPPAILKISGRVIGKC
jgi:hypothetical protein